MSIEHKFNIDDHVQFGFCENKLFGKIIAIYINKSIFKSKDMNVKTSYAIIPDGCSQFSIPLIANEDQIKPYKENIEPFSDEEIKQSISDLTVCGRTDNGCDGCSHRGSAFCNEVPAKAARIMTYLFGKCRA